MSKPYRIPKLTPHEKLIIQELMSKNENRVKEKVSPRKQNRYRSRCNVERTATFESHDICNAFNSQKGCKNKLEKIGCSWKHKFFAHVCNYFDKETMFPMIDYVH